MHHCIVCQREMSYPGVCSAPRCMVDTPKPSDIRYSLDSTCLVIRLAIAAMRHEHAAIMVRPIPKYFAEFPDWVVDYENLARVAQSLLVNLGSLNALSEPERVMLNWLISNNALHLGMISDQNCLGLKSPYHRIRFIEVTNTDAKLHEFNSKQVGQSRDDPRWLFHGSVDQHWYGIIRHGLMNMSKTSLSYNGAAFGKGIYCSDDWRIALSYCKASEVRIIAVVQPSQAPDVWARGIGTYVIPDARELIVRYLLLVSDISAKL